MGFTSVLEFAKKLVEAKVRPGDICIDATVGGGVDTLFLSKAVGAGGAVVGFDVQTEALQRAIERLNRAGVGADIGNAGPGNAGGKAGKQATDAESPGDRLEGCELLGSRREGGELLGSRREGGEWPGGQREGSEWLGSELEGGESPDPAGSTAPFVGVKLYLASHDRMTELIPAEWHGRVAAAMFNLGYLPGGNTTVVTKPNTSVRALEQAYTLLRPGGLLTVVLYTGHPGGTEEETAVRDWVGTISSQEAQALEYRFLHRKETAPYLLAMMKSENR